MIIGYWLKHKNGSTSMHKMTVDLEDCLKEIVAKRHNTKVEDIKIVEADARDYWFTGRC